MKTASKTKTRLERTVPPGRISRTNRIGASEAIQASDANPTFYARCLLGKVRAATTMKTKHASIYFELVQDEAASSIRTIDYSAGFATNFASIQKCKKSNSLKQTDNHHSTSTFYIRRHQR